LEIEDEALDEGISLGSYKLVEKIGAGGMGEVWLGKHDLLARPAAVKLIRADEVGKTNDTHRDRFQREAHTTANLRSPHTVQLYDFGVSGTGTFYYIMELLHGMDLDEMVRRFGPLPPGRVVMLLEQACRSLTEAHDRGLVHRDIKPANLFITALGPEFDFLKVLDFGMVKATMQQTDVALTVEGTAQGTPAFMAPELALGRGEVDGRADLYSLGCVAFWMLTGMLVFEAESPTHMLMQHVQNEPRRPSDLAEVRIPEALDGIVLRCLKKNPGDRPASARELGEELGSVECREPWTQERARKWWMRHAPDELDIGR
jgi:serine/threonine-protein kinase